MNMQPRIVSNQRRLEGVLRIASLGIDFVQVVLWRAALKTGAIRIDANAELVKTVVLR